MSPRQPSARPLRRPHEHHGLSPAWVSVTRAMARLSVTSHDAPHSGEELMAPVLLQASQAQLLNTHDSGWCGNHPAHTAPRGSCWGKPPGRHEQTPTGALTPGCRAVSSLPSLTTLTTFWSQANVSHHVHFHPPGCREKLCVSKSEATLGCTSNSTSQ